MSILKIKFLTSMVQKLLFERIDKQTRVELLPIRKHFYVFLRLINLMLINEIGAGVVITSSD